MLRAFSQKLDLRAGRFLDAVSPAYIEEKILTQADGVYSQSEWTRARQQGYRDAGVGSNQLDSDVSYVARLFTHQSYSMDAVRRLLETVDLSSYPAVFELGCGEMVQAIATKSMYPAMRYKATDFDPFVIEKCSRLNVLAPLEKSVVDATALTPEDLAGFSLVISWEMIYAFDEAKLTRLLGVLGKSRVPFLACTSQLLGPCRKFLHVLRGWKGQPIPGLRMHGWTSSVGRYRRLAAANGMKLARVWHPPFRHSRVESFSYLLFEPNRL
jgi:hypothetical protein